MQFERLCKTLARVLIYNMHCYTHRDTYTSISFTSDIHFCYFIIVITDDIIINNE